MKTSEIYFEEQEGVWHLYHHTTGALCYKNELVGSANQAELLTLWHTLPEGYHMSVDIIMTHNEDTPCDIILGVKAADHYTGEDTFSEPEIQEDHE